MIEQRNNSSVYMPFQFCFVFTDLSIKAKFKQNASLGFPAYKMSGFAGVYGDGAGLPGSSDSKESACSVGDLGSIPGLGRSPEKGTATCSSILAWRIPWAV